MSVSACGSCFLDLFLMDILPVAKGGPVGDGEGQGETLQGHQEASS